jgi:pimeloyl-ACP methyl ester carboxylesterase
MMTPTSHEISTPDGRTLAVNESGDPSGTAVFAHHGSPSCGFLDDDWTASATRRGIRLVAWDRPGYGGSSTDPGRRVASAATDAATIADALGIEQFRTWGFSGGGPHALACAALLPDRVPAVAVLAGVAPYDAPGLDWLAGMGQDNIEEFGAVEAGEAQLRRYLEEAHTGLTQALAEDSDAVVDEMASLLPEVDAAYLRTHLLLLEAMRVGLAPGYEGWLEDDQAFAAPWGFALGGIRPRTLVLQGGQDLMVPAAHGRYVAEAIPESQLRVLPDDGHLTMLNRVDEVHAWLLDA